MKLEKFPVIAPDGTEYRVTVAETHEVFGWRYEISVYILRKPRGLFRFKKVRQHAYKMDDDWSRASGDILVRLAQDEVKTYIESVNAKLAEERGIQEAEEAFRQWDGKISEAKQSEPEVSDA